MNIKNLGDAKNFKLSMLSWYAFINIVHEATKKLKQNLFQNDVEKLKKKFWNVEHDYFYLRQ